MEGQDIKDFREKHNLTQDELAKELMVASNTVARWERGERQIPNHLPLALETVERNQIAKAKAEG